MAEEYKLCPETLYLTVNYVDRFLSLRSVARQKLQLLGVTCMLVAAKVRFWVWVLLRSESFHRMWLHSFYFFYCVCLSP